MSEERISMWYYGRDWEIFLKRVDLPVAGIVIGMNMATFFSLFTFFYAY